MTTPTNCLTSYCIVASSIHRRRTRPYAIAPPVPPLHAHVVRLRGTDDHGINFQSSNWCWKTHSQWESVNHSISSTSTNLTLQWLQRWWQSKCNKKYCDQEMSRQITGLWHTAAAFLSLANTACQYICTLQHNICVTTTRSMKFIR